jgi:hypothetical protein
MRVCMSINSIVIMKKMSYSSIKIWYRPNVVSWETLFSGAVLKQIHIGSSHFIPIEEDKNS